MDLVGFQYESISLDVSEVCLKKNMICLKSVKSQEKANGEMKIGHLHK